MRPWGGILCQPEQLLAVRTHVADRAVKLMQWLTDAVVDQQHRLRHRPLRCTIDKHAHEVAFRRRHVLVIVDYADLVATERLPIRATDTPTLIRSGNAT